MLQLARAESGNYYYFTEDVIRSLPDGKEYRVTRAKKVPRIDDRIVHSVFYLYPSQPEAEAGSSLGGSGFLVSIASKEHPAEHDIYAVTCKHVIENGATVIRMGRKPPLNIFSESHRYYPLAASQWNLSDSQDIAVASLGRHSVATFDHYTIPSSALMRWDVIDCFNISLGDDIYMVGRFFHHDGGKTGNRPSVQSGIISQMPDSTYPVELVTGDLQEAFLVELRSISGYSGAPVIWKLPLIDIMTPPEISVRGPVKNLDIHTGPWLVGIQCSIYDENTVSVVIPAWLLQQELDQEEFVAIRKKENEKSQERRNASPVKFTSNKKQADVGITENEYIGLLQQASRKISPPDQETKET